MKTNSTQFYKDDLLVTESTEISQTLKQSRWNLTLGLILSAEQVKPTSTIFVTLSSTDSNKKKKMHEATIPAKH